MNHTNTAWNKICVYNWNILIGRFCKLQCTCIFFFFKTTLNAWNTVWLASISSGLNLSPMFRPRTLDWYPVMLTQALADSSHWESWSLQKDVVSLFTIYAHVIAWLSNIHVYIIKSSLNKRMNVLRLVYIESPVMGNYRPTPCFIKK